jgi:hypothetical protein
MKVGHHDLGTSKPQKSRLTKQSIEMQINATDNPVGTVKGGWTMPMHINMKELRGSAIGGDNDREIKQGAK